MATLHIERLPTGNAWGIYTDGGRRVAVAYSRREAQRKLAALRRTTRDR